MSVSRAAVAQEPVHRGERRTIDPRLDSLERALYEGASLDPLSARATRVEWMREAAQRHVEHCRPYTRLAAALGFEPSSVQTAADLERVPLLPSSLFKKMDLTSQSEGELVQCVSSGTRGTRSVVPRDSRTLERFMGSLVNGMRAVLDPEDAVQAFALSPPPSDQDDLWFSSVVGFVELIFETQFLVTDDEVDFDSLFGHLDAVPEAVRPVIVGPPPLVADFVDWLAATGRRLDLGRRRGLVVTGGGWKRRADEQIERGAFTARIEEHLGLTGDSIRDFYNMVELNTVIFECEGQRKHVPPWVEIIIRGGDLSVLPAGEVGVISFLDPTPTSYPGFVLSDDLGRLVDAACLCGRPGPTLVIERRLSRLEERGCALKMARSRRARVGSVERGVGR